MNYSVKSEINWLAAAIHGQYHHSIAIDFIWELIAVSTKKKKDVALIDIRQLSGKSSTIEIYEIGELLNAGKRSLNKIVMLCSQEHFRDDFLKTVLGNRGILYKATYREEEAMQWLQEFMPDKVVESQTKKARLDLINY